MEEREYSVVENILAPAGQSRSGYPDRAEKLPPDWGLVELMEEMPGGFLIYQADAEEKILYANRGLLRIFQCGSMEEFFALTGGSFRGMVHPEDRAAVEESIWQQIAASQYDLDYVEYRILRKDGAVCWIEDYGHFVHSAAMGDIFYVFLADATEKRERRQVEKNRLIREKENSERELRLQAEEYGRERDCMSQEYLRRMEVINGLGVNYESIFYLDLERNRILPYRLNRRTERIFGAADRAGDYNECIRQYIRDWVHPEDRERVNRETAPASIRSRLAQEPSFLLNYRVVEQGEEQHLQIRFANVGRESRPAQVVMGCRKVDEELRRDMEQKQVLEEALHSAELSITAKNTFLSNMSHDMRTPLNAIFGFTALARNRLNDQAALAGYLDRIEASSRQLLDMIDKVLRLSWLDSNEAQTEESPCRLGEILEEIHEFLMPQAQEKGIAFSLDCSQVRHGAVYSDREKLSQLVMYLANNAVTYTPPGGSVTITAAEREELTHSFAVYQITVEDTGIGIGEDFLRQIFEPFTRERNTTLSGVHGVGLGLTLARSLADLLGGAIEVSSAVDRGSAFTVTLRLRMQPSAGGDAGAQEKMPGRRILLVEDNEINLEIETEILQSLGFRIESAAHGGIAVEKVQNSPPGRYDLILMDIQMPVMDGWQAARAIRALPDPARSGIPIVALSANVFDSDIRTSLDAGMDAHLAKPVDVPRLLRTMEEVIGKRGRR